MSRQIYFYQTEEDMKEFFKVIEESKIIAVVNYFDPNIRDWGFTVINSIEELFECMNQYSSVNVNLCPSKYICYLSNGIPDFPRLKCGASVEYQLCKNVGRGQVVYRPGRIYLPTSNQNNLYRPEIADLYQVLYKYIRKNYLYEKNDSYYYAPDLLSRLNAGEVQVSPF